MTLPCVADLFGYQSHVAQELQHDLVEELRPLHLWQMSRVRDDCQLRAWDRGNQGSGRLPDVDDILVAIHDQGWSRDLRQSLRGWWFERDLFASVVVTDEEGRVHLAHALAHRRIDRVGFAIWT